MSLPRPSDAPRKIPLWAWHLNAWLSSGKQGPRPAGAPPRVPRWFWTWRLWRLARAAGAGSKQWNAYLALLHRRAPSGLTAARTAVVGWARWCVANAARIDYTMTQARDDWMAEPRGSLPIDTDCSGLATLCYRWSGLPDPNGLAYRYLGYTGTLLDAAARHGSVFTDLARALPGDIVVIGPGTGSHAVVVVEAGADPLIVSHGHQAPDDPSEYRLSLDGRQPKRVCRTLPA